MSTLFSSLTAIFIIIPILFFILVYAIIKKITGNHRRARNIAINLTTVVLIFSVHYLILSILKKSMLWVIILFILITGALFTLYHWKKHNEIIYSKIIIGVWRLNFLLFAFCYIVLFIYGITKSAIQGITS